jgi:hypothetical protein
LTFAALRPIESDAGDSRGFGKLSETNGAKDSHLFGFNKDVVIKDREFAGLKTHRERLTWRVEGLKDRESGEASDSFAVRLNGPCKNASGHVWPLLHACAGHSKFTHFLNTIPPMFIESGKTRIEAASILYPRQALTARKLADAIVIVEVNESIVLDADGTDLLL